MSRYTINARFVANFEWPGTPTPNWKRKRGTFKVTPGRTQADLQRELGHLRAKNVTIHLDCDPGEIRKDGYPRSNARVRGPGVIVSFDLPDGTQLSYPCDTYTHWDDNLRAITLALAALRAVDRYGVTKRGEQYQGWAKLPPAGGSSSTMTANAAAQIIAELADYRADLILGDRIHASTAIRRAAMKTHPDTGGTDEQFHRWKAASTVLNAHHGGAR